MTKRPSDDSFTKLEQLDQVLLDRLQSGDVRKRAEETLKTMELDDPVSLSRSLIEAFQETKNEEVRVAAGITMRELIIPKDDEEKANRWLSTFDQTLKADMKQMALNHLSSPDRVSALLASGIITHIAFVEFPEDQWPQLLDDLIIRASSANPLMREISLITLSSLFEALNASYFESKSDEILNAIHRGIEDDVDATRAAGCDALFHYLEFMKSRFKDELDRIMQNLMKNLRCPDHRVRIQTMNCLTKIATLYYDHLRPYASDVSKVIKCIKEDQNEDVIKSALKFWIEISEKETFEDEDDEELNSHHIIRSIVKDLVPILFEKMTHQQIDVGPNQETSALLAADCIAVMGGVIGNAICNEVMPLIKKHLRDPNWRFREASTLALGGIAELLSPKIYAIVLDPLLDLVADDVRHVRDTAAWTMSQIFATDSIKFHPANKEKLIRDLLSMMVNDVPETAAVAAHCLFILAPFHIDQSDFKFFSDLQKCLKRDEPILQTACFEVMSGWIAACGPRCQDDILGTVPQIQEQLNLAKTESNKEKQKAIYGGWCAVLNSIVEIANAPTLSYHADEMMLSLMDVLELNPCVDALITIGHLASKIELRVARYMQRLQPLLIKILSNDDEDSLELTAAVYGDLSRALVDGFAPYAEETIKTLISCHTRDISEEIKTKIISAFGDIALAISGEIARYLSDIMPILRKAATNVAEVDVLNNERSIILETYTGIIQGLRAGSVADRLLPYLPDLITLIKIVAADRNRSSTAMLGALGCVGDILQSLGPQARSHFADRRIVKLVMQGNHSEDETIQAAAAWVAQLLNKS
eukprot:TRINITY_DN7388_c0_g1_i1.p1 TRINITY_DN7388_c0_g1~~TRINITY_DN7388_c0_g1_i1.p1  ORF type:complete len:817 (+),score=179.98 TRINITY_DN7388_c0_g1_i1:3-2453(+)